MNRLSLLKTVNLACALAQGLGFWLLAVHSRQYLGESPWTGHLLPTAGVYGILLPLGAAFFNRWVLPFAAPRRLLYPAAFLFTAAYGYLVLFGFGIFDHTIQIGAEKTLGELLVYPLIGVLWGAGVALPLWLLFSLGLGFTLSRLYAKRDYLPEER